MRERTGRAVRAEQRNTHGLVPAARISWAGSVSGRTSQVLHWGVHVRSSDRELNSITDPTVDAQRGFSLSIERADQEDWSENEPSTQRQPCVSHVWWAIGDESGP